MQIRLSGPIADLTKMKLGFIKIEIKINIRGLAVKEDNDSKFSLGRLPQGAEEVSSANELAPLTPWRPPVRADATLPSAIAGPDYRKPPDSGLANLKFEMLHGTVTCKG